MALTAAQLQTLKTDISNNVNTIPSGFPWSGSFAGTAINVVPNSGDGNAAIAGWYNLLTAAFRVYRNNIPVQEIYNNITWANLTPADVPDTTQQWLNRAMQCQGKQFNLQIILQGQNIIDSTKANIRAGLQDALTNVPSGASGATVSAGWVPVRDSLYTLATNAEKLFATGTGTTASPATRVVYGNISGDDVQNARNS